MSILTVGGISGSLQPAWCVGEIGVCARKVNFTLGDDIASIKLFKMNLNVAVITNFELTDLSISGESL
jgi:hypothetical protein